MMTPAVLHWLIVANGVALAVNALSAANNIWVYLRMRRKYGRLLADLRTMEAQLRGLLTMKKIQLGEDVDG